MSLGGPGMMKHDETTLLPFCCAIGTFYYFPLDIDFLSSPLNFGASEQASLSTVFRRRRTAAHTRVHTRTANTAQTPTWINKERTVLEEEDFKSAPQRHAMNLVVETVFGHV